MRFLRRFAQLLVLVAMYALTVFFVPPALYVPWAAAGLLLVMLWLVLVARFGSSRAQEALIRSLAADYLRVRKQESDTRETAMTKEFTCPSCSAATNYWVFLDKGACPQCGSELWSVRVPELDDSYAKLLRKKETVDAFYAKLTPSMLRKVKSHAMYLES